MAVGRRIRGLDATERRAQRREQLLDAALELFARDGYQNVSIEQLCQAAYVGTKAFYELFDSREDCYIALLQRISEQIEAEMTAALREAPADADKASELLVTALVHALVDDPRRAKVTFGEAAAVSRDVERQRRLNRRWAATFVESVWKQYGAIPARRRRGAPDPHRMAIGTIGGMFDLVADWLLDADPSDPAAVKTLTADLLAFYTLLRTALPTT